ISDSALPNKVIYPYDLTTGEVCSEEIFVAQYPNTWRYLESSREALRGRSYFERSNKKWYELWCQRDPLLFVSAKILGPEIAKRGEFTLCRAPLFFNNKLKGIVLDRATEESIGYILGVLNSRLLVFMHRLIAPPKGSGYFEVKTVVLGRLPIQRVDFANAQDVARHDHMVELVDRMLSLHKQLGAAKTPTDKTAIQRQIDATDRQIDQLVYELYDLTDEEIRIVEEATQ
ncbi:MAG: restriction endonuclease subunit M, partial [Planctomycetes bacterium]|nr:restriction endonuclease subunit M [Planctomycetota bacterium]